MVCKKCGFTNPDDMKYCGSCGKLLSTDMKFSWSDLILGSILIIAFAAICAVYVSNQTGVFKSSSNYKSVTTVAENANATWHRIAAWKGSGHKTTDAFTITGSKWRINWRSYNENITGIMQIFVYKSNGDMVDLVANSTGEGQDVSYIHSPGSFYLDIMGTNLDWEVSIEDYR